MDELVTIIIMIIALIAGFMVGLFTKVTYTYEVYESIIETVENAITNEVIVNE